MMMICLFLISSVSALSFLNLNFLLIFGIYYCIWNFMFLYGNMSFSPMSSYFYLDEMSLSLILLSAWISLLMILAEINNKNKFLFQMITSILFMMLCFCFMSNNFMLFYIFFEIILIPIFFMIFMLGNQYERIQAAFYMILYTMLGSLPLLLLINYMMKFINMSFLFLKFNPSNMNMFMTLFIMMAFLIKLPMYGFHIWLPKAHVEAPVSGSMLLAGILLKLGVFGLYRMSLTCYYYCFLPLSNIIMSLCLIGGIIVSFNCMRQVDTKMLIAYSSVSHMGLILSGYLSNTLLSLNGAVYLMIAHGLCSSGLFFMANMFYERFYSRNMIMMKGMMYMYPSLALWWFFLCIFNMGAPPSMNLLAELTLSMSALKFSIINFMPLIVLNFMCGFYSIYLYSMIMHGKFHFNFSTKMIEIREFTVIIFHVFPLILYVFKTEIFNM